MGAFGRPSKFEHEAIRAFQPKPILSEGIAESERFTLRFIQDEGAVLDEILSQVTNSIAVVPHEPSSLVKEERYCSLVVVG